MSGERERSEVRGRRRSERRGRRAEAQAAWFLRAKGYRIIDRRFRTPGGEIDLIVRRGRTVAFVEVKHRADREAAAHAVSPQARRRIASAAAAWLARHDRGGVAQPRFDVVLMAPGRLPRHLPGAFEAGP